MSTPSSQPDRPFPALPGLRTGSVPLRLTQVQDLPHLDELTGRIMAMPTVVSLRVDTVEGEMASVTITLSRPTLLVGDLQATLGRLIEDCWTSGKDVWVRAAEPDRPPRLPLDPEGQSAAAGVNGMIKWSGLRRRASAASRAGAGVAPGPAFDPNAMALKALASLPGMSMLLFDAELRFRFASGAALGRHGYEPGDLVGCLAPDLLPPASWQRLEPAYRGALGGQTTVVEVPSSDGTATYEATIGPLYDADRPVGGVVISRDVTAQRRREAEAAASRELLHRSFDLAPIGKALVAPDGRWLRVNEALCRFLGRTREELLATSFQDLTHPDDLDGDLALLRETLDGRRDGYQIEKRYRHADGHVVWALLAVSLVRGPGGEPLWFVSQLVDLTERKTFEMELLDRADRDALTGLLNRRRLDLEIGRRHAESLRTGRPASLLFIDLDGFKGINDTYGHLAGDAALVAVAECIRGVIRADDCCARLGGDEFAVLLPYTDAATAALVADRLSAAIALMPVDELPAGAMTATVGTATVAPGMTEREWLRAADDALLAKRRRRTASHRTEAAGPPA